MIDQRSKLSSATQRRKGPPLGMQGTWNRWKVAHTTLSHHQRVIMLVMCQNSKAISGLSIFGCNSGDWDSCQLPQPPAAKDLFLSTRGPCTSLRDFRKSGQPKYLWNILYLSLLAYTLWTITKLVTISLIAPKRSSFAFRWWSQPFNSVRPLKLLGNSF